MLPLLPLLLLLLPSLPLLPLCWLPPSPPLVALRWLRVLPVVRRLPRAVLRLLLQMLRRPTGTHRARPETVQSIYRPVRRENVRE